MGQGVNSTYNDQKQKDTKVVPVEHTSGACAVTIVHFFFPEDSRMEGSEEAKEQQVFLIIYLIVCSLAKGGHPLQQSFWFYVG